MMEHSSLILERKRQVIKVSNLILRLQMQAYGADWRSAVLAAGEREKRARIQKDKLRSPARESVISAAIKKC
jgi:hypothetical protein